MSIVSKVVDLASYRAAKELAVHLDDTTISETTARAIPDASGYTIRRAHGSTIAFATNLIEEEDGA